MQRAKKAGAPPAKKAAVSGSGGGVSAHRYAAAVEKGDNAWKREWAGFISGVKMAKEGAGVKLPACMDFERQDESTFSYLFASPAEKKAARLAKAKAAKEKLRKEQEALARERQKQRRAAKKETSGDESASAGDDDDGDDSPGAAAARAASKHARAVLEAERLGLRLADMNRKQKREFLQLTKSAAQRAAEEVQHEAGRAVKPHELMDEKAQWYQQGPYPLDVIAEKLVIKKALKHAKQLGLKYNYLTVHPSWAAARARKRRDAQLAPLGHRLVFDDDDDVEEVEVEERVAAASGGEGGATVAKTTKRKLLRGKRTLPASAVPMLAGSALRRANLTTTFMSSALVRPASVGLL